MDDDSQAPMGQLSAHLDRGWDLATRGDYAGAMVSAEKSLELDDDSPEVHCLIGYIYQAEGRPEDALEAFKAALDLEESCVDAMLRSADVLINPLARFDDAQTMLADALYWLEEDEVDERADAMLLQVEVHIAKGDLDVARRVAADLPEGPFNEPTLPFSIGRAFFEVGELERAEPMLTKALESAPSADVHYFLALVQEAKGATTESLLSFLRARELEASEPPERWSAPREEFQGIVQAALTRLSEGESGAAIDGALVIVTDLPGAEVVAEGVDPRASVLIDWSQDDEPKVVRIFVYQRNVQRVVMATAELAAQGAQGFELEIASAIERELEHAAEAIAEDRPEAD